MSWTKTGECPHCGAPIYSPGMWHGILPPPPQYTCNCRLAQAITGVTLTHTKPCNHCYCMGDQGGTSNLTHKVCCKCGDRVLASGTYTTCIVNNTGGQTSCLVH